MTIDDVIKNDFEVFIPFDMSKSDKSKHMVYGLATTDHLDAEGEVVTKEAVQKAWPAYAAFGNIREMHTNKAAGKLQKTVWKDGSPYICAKIVDKDAWNKVTEEVYMGWSIGGKKLAKKGNQVTAVKISEISLVDRPSNPEALFDLYKADRNGEENDLMEKVGGHEIHTLQFPMAKFTLAEAKAWAMDHNFEFAKVDAVDGCHQVTQFDSSLCVKGTFSTWDLDKDMGIQATSCSKKGDDMDTKLVDAGPVLRKFVEAMAKVCQYENADDLKKNFETAKDLIQHVSSMAFLTKEVKGEEGKAGHPGEGASEPLKAAVDVLGGLAIKYSADQIAAAIADLGGAKPESVLVSGEDVKEAMAKVEEMEKQESKFSEETAKTFTDMTAQIESLVAKTKGEMSKMDNKTFTDEENKNAEAFGKLSDTEKADLQKSDASRFKVLEAAHELVNKDEPKPEPVAKAEDLAKVEDLAKRTGAIEETLKKVVDQKDDALKKLDDEVKAKDEALAKVETLGKEVDDLKKSNETLTTSNEAMKKQVAKPNANAAPSFLGKTADSGDKEIDNFAQMQIVAQTKKDVTTLIKMSRDKTLRKDLEGKTYTDDEMKKLEDEGKL